MRRVAPHLLPVAAVLALGVGLFASWMHPSVLDPTNRGWLLLGDDRGQGAIGTAAYLRASGDWPGLRQPLLSAPEGLPLLFTDSIPLIGFIVRPFVAPSATGLQFVGIWYLLCALLQATFAWLLVRRHARDPLAALIGTALLAAMPMFLARYPHASLCAQWLILWALWVFVDPARSRSRWWWPAVLGVAAMVHSYLLLGVAAVWTSSLLAALATEPTRGRTLARAALAVLPAGLILAAHGVFDGSFVSSGLYGQWPLALDAWWNPLNPGYARLLPSSPDRLGSGFEGLQYLGAGLIALVAAAAALLARGGVAPKSGADLRRLRWLLPAFVVVAAVAVGPTPLWQGTPLFTLSLPRGLVDLLDPVRAAPRLMWPFTYALAFAAIAAVASTRRATLFLTLALALQIVDLSPMVAAIRATSARADDRTVFARTLDPRWATYVARAGAIDFQPPDQYADLALMQEISWRAIESCRPVLFTYAARQTTATRRRIATGAAQVAVGRVPADRMVVFLRGAPPPALAGVVEQLDGIAVLPPRRAAPPSGLCRSQ